MAIGSRVKTYIALTLMLVFASECKLPLSIPFTIFFPPISHTFRASQVTADRYQHHGLLWPLLWGLFLQHNHTIPTVCGALPAPFPRAILWRSRNSSKEFNAKLAMTWFLEQATGFSLIYLLAGNLKDWQRITEKIIIPNNPSL